MPEHEKDWKVMRAFHVGESWRVARRRAGTPAPPTHAPSARDSAGRQTADIVAAPIRPRRVCVRDGTASLRILTAAAMLRRGRTPVDASSAAKVPLALVEMIADELAKTQHRECTDNGRPTS